MAILKPTETLAEFRVINNAVSLLIHDGNSADEATVLEAIPKQLIVPYTGPAPLYKDEGQLVMSDVDLRALYRDFYLPPFKVAGSKKRKVIEAWTTVKDDYPNAKGCALK